MTAQQQQAPPKQMFHATVKQINSGDSLVIKALGKNLEKTIMLGQINAARLGRTSKDGTVEPDQPYAFEAREFLRKKLVGKEVIFVKEATTTSGTDRGTLFLGKDITTGENINEALVSAGLVEVRRLNKPNEEEARLVALEEQAKSAGLGKWSKDSEASHVRDVKYTLENAKSFVDSHKQKPIDAIIEYVRDGSTVRALLLPSMHNVTIQLSGVKCPAIKQDAESEPFAEEARQFLEARLLQRDIQVVLEGVANQSNGILLGTLRHPNGNISEFLLREGLARCVDWSMGVVTSGPEKYRNAEKQAKTAKLRMWKNYSQTASSISEADKTLSGKVVEVSNGDAVTVKVNDTYKKLFLSSIRPPRQSDFEDTLPRQADRKNNQLYDVPYLFEAREYLRKKLIGKKVNCTIDYVQPKQENYPEKVCATVMFGDINVAEALVSQGLARVIRYKQDDDQRSCKYDDLLAAEARAQKKASGLHSTKPPTTMKINDTSNDANKTKQLLPFFQRLGRMDAVCEYVSSGSRFRLYLPKETCLITLLLSGVDCPRLGRPAQNNMPAQNSDEYAEDAFMLVKSKTFQHEVKVEIENIDKNKNFIGQIFAQDGTNLSVALVEAGYAAVHRTAYNSPYYSQLAAAEKNAKDKKLNRWKNFVEEKPVDPEEARKNEPTERVVAQKKIIITELTPEMHFYGQLVENGPKLEKLMDQLRTELETRPPVPGSYTPKVNDVCVAQFSMDDEWYRAKVLSVKSSGEVTVLFIDYGNKEVTRATRLADIPAGFETLPAQSHEYALAMVNLGSDEDDIENAIDCFKSLLDLESEPQFNINVEYKVGSVDFVTLTTEKKVDIGKQLVNDGFVSVDRQRRERSLQKLLTEYLKTLSAAKAAHRNMWRYGDKEQDDALEFGYKK